MRVSVPQGAAVYRTVVTKNPDIMSPALTRVVLGAPQIIQYTAGLIMSGKNLGQLIEPSDIFVVQANVKEEAVLGRERGSFLDFLQVGPYPD